MGFSPECSQTHSCYREQDIQRARLSKDWKKLRIIIGNSLVFSIPFVVNKRTNIVTRLIMCLISLLM